MGAANHVTDFVLDLITWQNLKPESATVMRIIAGIAVFTPLTVRIVEALSSEKYIQEMIKGEEIEPENVKHFTCFE